DSNDGLSIALCPQFGYKIITLAGAIEENINQDQVRLVFEGGPCILHVLDDNRLVRDGARIALHQLRVSRFIFEIKNSHYSLPLLGSSECGRSSSTHANNSSAEKGLPRYSAAPISSARPFSSLTVQTITGIAAVCGCIFRVVSTCQPSILGRRMSR